MKNTQNGFAVALIVAVITILAIGGGIYAYLNYSFLYYQILRGSGQITAEEALQILKGDNKCGNPSSVEKTKVAYFDNMNAGAPKGEYWKSSTFAPSDPTAPVSLGCSKECYLVITNKSKTYYHYSCM